ncbi:MAG: antitoxin [Acidimicrobiia bacterium]|nr:antitoxin [Acidimicrobiia bacterium]
MATSTATIRVSSETRDLLAEHAERRGLSLAGFVTALAHRVEREQLFEAEREAARLDATNSEVANEESDWGTVLDDGIA